MSTPDLLDARIREALRDKRPDPDAFEAGVRERIDAAPAASSVATTGAAVPGWVRVAASILPMPFLAGGKVLAGVAKVGPVGFGSKIIAWLTLPAMSLCLLLGAFVYGVVQARRVTEGTGTDDADASLDDIKIAMKAWFRRWGWAAGVFYLGLFCLPFFGKGTWVFGVLVVSFFVFALALVSLARAGLATRPAIGSLCGTAFWLLSMYFGMGMAGNSIPHLWAPALLPTVWYGGWALLAAIQWWGTPVRHDPRFRKAVPLLVVAVLFVALLVGWIVVPRLIPTTTADVQEYVEEFNSAPYGSASWRDWEFAATWLQREQRTYDDSTPRALFEQELRGEQNRYVLSRAMRTGLLRPSDFSRLQELDQTRDSLLEPRSAGRRLGSLGQQDWAIRVLAVQGRLSDPERDLLAGRLAATLQHLADDDDPYGVLEEALRTTQLLAAIDRPVDVDAWAPQVHAWLEACRRPEPFAFRRAGGFATYPSGGPSYDGTYYAIELMRIYGFPASLDANEIRNFLVDDTRVTDAPYVLAAMRDTFEALPDVPRPTLWDILYYERTLIASILLVLLCIYAMLRASPAAAAKGTEPASRANPTS